MKRVVIYEGNTYGEREFDRILYNEAKEAVGDDINAIAEYIGQLFDSGIIVIEEVE